MNITKILGYFKRHVVLASALGAALIVIMIIAGRVASRDGASASVTAGARQVALVDATAFRQDVSSVTANGTVESVAQADLRSQASAPVSYLGVGIGDAVYAGQVILELKNADIRARLDQAKAALVLAQGGGAVSLSSARASAIDESRDAYSDVDQAIRGQIDQFLFNFSGSEQPLASRLSDLKLVDRLHAARDDLTGLMDAWKAELDALSPSSTDADLTKVLSRSKSVLVVATSLIDDVLTGLNTVTKDASGSTLATLNGWKATATAAKASLSGASAAIKAADIALQNSSSSQGVTAQANISAAEAGVKSLEAELAKTILTSPISGKIATLPLRVGELATPGALLATVVGGQGLQVRAYASSEDISRIAKGAAVLIQGSVTGTVSAVAPSVNQANKKVEVTIAVSNPDLSNLVIGQNVSVSIKSNVKSASSPSASYFLPIQNVKIVPGDAYVFTVDADSKVVRHSVVLGSVSGDFVEVTSGITDDMKLATPVYELEEGQSVDVR